MRHAVFAVVAVAFSVPARAQEPFFDVTGQAPVVAQDTAKARERALDEAMRQAVTKAAESLIGADGVAQKQNDLRLRILPKARNYVANYRVVQEGAEGPIFQVHLMAQVALGKLARELQGAAPPPVTTRDRAIVCVEVTRGEGFSALLDSVRAAAEQPLSKWLAGRGAEIGQRMEPPCTDDAVQANQTRSGANLAVWAQVEISSADGVRGTDLVAVRAKGHLRLREKDKIASDRDLEAHAYHQSWATAADKATQEVMSDFIAQSAGALKGTTDIAPGIVLVRLTSPRGVRYAEYSALVRTLGSLPGATTAPRRFARRECEIEVHTAQSAPQLVQSLARLAPIAAMKARSAADNLVVVDFVDDPAATP